MLISFQPDEMSTPLIPSRLPMALALGQQQQLAQAATLEHLRERLERGAGGAGGAAADGPEKKVMQLAEEQQRLIQQALQQNLLAIASHFNPMNLKLNNGHGELPLLLRYRPDHYLTEFLEIMIVAAFSFLTQKENRICL